MGKKQKKSNKHNYKNKVNNQSSSNLKNKQTNLKNKQNDILSDMVSFTNYDLDKRLILEETKKIDIEKIFEKSPQQTTNKKSNLWKILSLILFLIIILLVFLYFSSQKNTIEPNCEVINNNSDEEENEPDDNKIEQTKQERYLFLGDSLFYQYDISEYFKDYDVIDSGVDGVTARETLEDLDNRIYQYNPTTVFILLGTNDIGKDYTPLETFEYLKNIVEKIKVDRPEITVNIMSLLPINNTDDPKVQSWIYEHRSNEKIDEVNQYLKEYCEKNELNYINVHDVLLGDDGQLKLNYTREGLHITEVGYYHITMELLKYMEK